MKFELAFSTIREYGGYMKRMSYPNVSYFIDSKENILKSNNYYMEDETQIYYSDDALIYGSEIMAEDWEVDIEGCWKD